MDPLTLLRWPIVACLVLPGLLVYYGLHIVRRGIIFVDLALAQVAALGSCLAVLLGYDIHDWQTFALSASFTLVGAAIFTLTSARDPRVPHEALIGIVYVVAAAAGVLVLSRSAGGDEELRRTLVGDVLLVRRVDILKTFGLYAVVGVIHWLFRRPFLRLTFEPQAADRGGAKKAWDFLFYALFGFVVTSFVQIGGVLLVFSYLIVPAVAANLLVEGLCLRVIVGWFFAIVASGMGIIGSLKLDLPTGAAIVCSLGGLLLLVAIVPLWRGRWAASRNTKG